MSVDFRNYIINSDRPLIDAKPAAWKVNIDSSVGGDATTGGTGGLFWQLSHTGVVTSSLSKAGNLMVTGTVKPGQYTTAGLPAASAAGVGAIVYDTTVSKLKVSNGVSWETVTSA